MAAFNLDDASYSTKHFATGSYESAAYGNTWGDSGNKWYLVGTSGDSVDEFDASTPYDVSTLSYVQTFALRVGVGQERNPQGIQWQPDGMAFFGVTSYQDKVFKYTVSSAWDVSTAAYSQTFGVSGQTTDPRSMALSSDGTKFWVLSSAGVIYAYTMSTGFDLSGAAYASVSKTLSAGTESTWASMWTNGDELFVAGTTDDTVYHWSLSTTWDLSTAGSVLSDVYDFSAESVALASLAFKPDGSSFYIVSDDLATDEVFQYDITVSTPFSADLTAATVAVLADQALAYTAAFVSQLTAPAVAVLTEQDLSYSVTFLGALTSATLDPLVPPDLAYTQGFTAALDAAGLGALAPQAPQYVALFLAELTSATVAQLAPLAVNYAADVGVDLTQAALAALTPQQLDAAADFIAELTSGTVAALTGQFLDIVADGGATPELAQAVRRELYRMIGRR